MLRVPSLFALFFAFSVIVQQATMAAPVSKNNETTWESVKTKFNAAGEEFGVYLFSLFLNAEQKALVNDMKNIYVKTEEAIEEYNDESKETKDEFIFAAKKLTKILDEFLEIGKKCAKAFNRDESSLKKFQLLYGQMKKDIEAIEKGIFITWIQKIDI